jgi:outer membrane protein assembly factor BamE (lipoprotein component of BamABCDE complex)
MKALAASIIVACLGISGCGLVRQGNSALAEATDASLAQSLHQGETTEAQVMDLYGEPQNKAVDPQGHEQWDYFYNQAGLPFVGGGEAKHLQLIFSGKGKLMHYSLTERKQ